MMAFEEGEDSYKDQIFEIGRKSSTAGWFVSEGEAVLLTHSDGSCSYYDIANCEEKAEYKPPEGLSNNLWNDCWLIRAPGADGCSGRYVVAASAGSALESGFCSWDFYTKNVQAYLVDYGTPSSISMSSSRTALAPITNTGLSRRSISCSMPTVENRQCWYKPCGPLLISTASRQKTISAYDIRDGDLVMKWDVTSPVVSMEYSSPLQWRSRGKVIVAETEAISLWDVNSLTPQPLLSVASSGKKIACLHVNNTDAEIGGGVRQRVRSSEVEGNDGVFCTQDSINVFDFRLPSGVGLKISRHGLNAHSIFSCGDSIFIGTTEARLPLRSGPCSRVQQFSLRRGKLSATYALPDSSSHAHHSSITQVWGNSNFVMGICGMGLFVFDALKDEPVQIFSSDRGNIMEVKERVGPDDLYCPTFDYLASRVLVVSRDRPAVWRYL
ncbi:deSI-like protein [Iris pallida]|nr:deSI-like protein [Iris pallida]